MKIIHLLILTIFLGLLFRFVLVARHVECFLPGATLEAGVCEKINTALKGSSLFFTDWEQSPVWENLLDSQEYSQAYQYQDISKSLSGLVTLTLVAKMPDYRLVTSQGSYLLNQSNKLRNDRADLSLLSIQAELSPQSLTAGYLDDKLHQQFFLLAQALNQYGFTNSQVEWLSDQEIKIKINNLVILLDNQEDFVYQVDRLRAILDDQEFKALLGTGRVLDLRFNLPVLK